MLDSIGWLLVFELIPNSLKASIFCSSSCVDYLPNGFFQVANGVWLYYISKIVELFDTVLFRMRKRDRQITFLHVYHHSTMPLLWWIGAKWLPGGQGTSCYHSYLYISRMEYFVCKISVHVPYFFWLLVIASVFLRCFFSTMFYKHKIYVLYIYYNCHST